MFEEDWEKMTLNGLERQNPGSRHSIKSYSVIYFGLKQGKLWQLWVLSTKNLISISPLFPAEDAGRGVGGEGGKHPKEVFL